MKSTANTAAAVTAAAVMGAGAAWAVPVVYDVTMAQIEYSRQVRVTYKLTNANAIVTLSIETNGVAIPDSAVTRLSGDVCKEIAADESATREIIWNAGADWPEHETETAKARVTAWSVDAPPQVMVIDLGKGTAASWPENPYPVRYYPSLNALLGGVTDSVYKTSLLVLNKIPSGHYNMGEVGQGVYTNVMQDFYAGVFEVTQEQWKRVTGLDPSGFKNPEGPVEKISYYQIRENPNNSDDPAVNWPENDLVNADSFMGLLRVKTGVIGLDLPSELQWEYLCRAGTSSYYNDGVSTSSSNTDILNELALWKNNSESTTHTVGLKQANAWGLYDTLGNVWELCLDWFTFDSSRVRRGGSWNTTAADTRAAVRNFSSPNSVNYYQDNVGFRLVCNLP